MFNKLNDLTLAIPSIHSSTGLAAFFSDDMGAKGANDDDDNRTVDYNEHGWIGDDHYVDDKGNEGEEDHTSAYVKKNFTRVFDDDDSIGDKEEVGEWVIDETKNLFYFATETHDEVEIEKIIDSTTCVFTFKSEKTGKEKSIEVANNSLFIFDGNSEFRRKCVSLAFSPKFSSFITGTILANSIMFAITDYKHVDIAGNTVKDGSTINSLGEKLDIIFNIIFTCECITKIIAMGFFSKRCAYLNDSWNWLDFAVVVTGLVSFLPGIGNGVAAIKAFRLLRPLRSISSIPGLKIIVSALFNALPGLGDVLIVLFLFCLLYFTAGQDLFGGPTMHTRCRLTPFPVNLSWYPGLDYNLYECLPGAELFNTENEHPLWAKEDSPWFKPQDCYWPIKPLEDAWDHPLCALPGTNGKYACAHDPQYTPEDEWTWCGSNYDALGNYRFTQKDPWPSNPLAETDLENYIYQNFWGYVNFDTFPRAFVLIMKCITQDGYSDQMHMLKDAKGVLSNVYFISLDIFGGFGVISLLLAVLESKFSESMEEKTAPVVVEENEEPVEMKEENEVAIVPEEKSFMRKLYDMLPSAELPPIDMSTPWGKFRSFVIDLDGNQNFENLMLSVVVINTVLLCADDYPPNMEKSAIILDISFFLSLLFGVEMTVKIISIGILKYLSFAMNWMDGAVVIVSLLEIVLDPPPFIDGAPAGGKSPISVLRIFRLLRLAKLFKVILKNKEVRSIIKKLVTTLQDMVYFTILLFLLIFIFSTMGMQFFANKFRFDSLGYPIKQIYSQEW